ncbi:MAG TPA: hypothetical protein VH137_09470, partial [Gemmatimonadales bacterium]|nr:hypothetical protein [Gemmatimonadales bacterium]
TTRVGGADTTADAAAVARLVYPGLTPSTRPRAVVVVDRRNWSAALAASSLSSAPLRAPLIYSDGNSMPQISRQTIEAVRPTGSPALGGAQVIRIGTSAPLPAGVMSRSLPGVEPASVAAAVEEQLRAANGGRAPHQVIVLAANAPRAIEMPAAGLAAESGAPILFVTTARVPAPTAAVLTALGKPSIYVIGSAAVGARTLRGLSRYGPVTEMTSTGASAEPEAAAVNAISVARFTDGVFGWGVKEPGHGLVFASSARALDAPASALLSSTGDYGPQLLFESPTRPPQALMTYLADIQPAYTTAPQFRPVRGVYNHGWLIGDERAISAVSQAELDSALEISPRKPSPEEPSATTGE